jgi:alpha-galactosidase
MRCSCGILNVTLSIVLLTPLAVPASFGQLRPATRENDIALENKFLKVDYHAQTGRVDIVWSNGNQLIGIESGAQLADGQSLLTSAYTAHELVRQSVGTGGSEGREITIRSSEPGKPALIQHIVISDSQPWISIQAELERDASAIGTRHFDTVMLRGADAIKVKDATDLRVLHVPFDNDMWFRYKSALVSSIKDNETFSSEEVTAIYDNLSRQSIVLGSLTHDTWKTAIDTRTEGGRLAGLDIYGGISSPNGVRTDTHDTVPHGIVRGARVVSPRIFIGSFSDWRDGLEAYGAANANVGPPLVWPAGAPVGWNSWAAYGEKINYSRYLGAAAFVRNDLLPEGFERKKIVYINLDAFWSRLDAVQLADAVATIKAMHGSDGTRFGPGIYWTPFAYWSDDLDAWVEGTGMKYRYRDILLKAPDGSLLPKVDGGRPIDPSHPGTKARTSYFLNQFQQMGFSYLKLDFLSHGALEGNHFDRAIQTGIQAYNEGMKQIVDETSGRMFLSLSIAPLFPSGYGHARRLSCDTKGHIGGGDQSTEYMLNSLTYGWWTNKNLYIADPDHVVLGEKADLGARSVEEGKSRLLSAIITSGMILDSSRLADDEQGRSLAKEVYDSRNLFAVADEGQAFRPIEGDTGDKAATAFVRRSKRGFYLAIFNYDDKQSQAITLSLDRIDQKLASASTVAVTDVASGQSAGSVHGTLGIQLKPAESKLLELGSEQ